MSSHFLKTNEFDEVVVCRRSLSDLPSQRDTETLSSVEFRRRTATELVVQESPPPATQHQVTTQENCTLFDDLTRMADKNEPVNFEAFRQSSTQRTSLVSETLDMDENEEKVAEEKDQKQAREAAMEPPVDTELLEAYLTYCKSIGHEPNIQIAKEIVQDEGDVLNSERAAVPEQTHLWTDFIGTRYSKQRGCVQFWTWMLIGVGVVVLLGVSLSSLQLNEVLHLDAITAQNVQVTQDYTYLHFLEETDFHFTYTIETPNPETLSPSKNPNASYFNALLLDENEYENYVGGEPFTYVAAGSTLRTTFANLPRTYIDNTVKEEMFFVIQPCYLERNPIADYCQTTQLPSSVNSDQKIYDLEDEEEMNRMAVWQHFNVTYISVNPMPVACSSSGIVGGAYLLLFLPYLIITLFGLRIIQMVSHCESFRTNVERIYARELDVPENEVDYWQPMPWDRKVPKTRLCGPCCWKKFRRPFEPFYTWWRHENYFTWVFFPYRNEQLSRGERALIVVCSLYITFYVLFIIVMLRDSWGSDITIFTSVVLYAILVTLLPSAGKAIFKELFKLIFRQRRKYFRAKAAGGDLRGFSFRLAFFLQILVAVLLTLVQGPIFYIWAFRSCLFLKQFIYYGVLAAITRMSLVGLVQDGAWYLIIKTWGWKDLCPYCTERIKHCDCFNDEVLVIAVQHVGPKWELILVLDGLLARQNHYDPQFELYTSEQLRERWEVIVERAHDHIEEVEKLRAYREKKRQDARRHDRTRRSLTGLLPFHDNAHDVPAYSTKDNDKACKASDSTSDCDDADENMCNLREKKILALNSEIQLDSFEKHYDSNISEVFHALTRSITKRRRHDTRAQNSRHEHEDDNDNHRPTRTPLPTRQSSSSSSHDETMWVFDTPAQRLERRSEERLQRKRAFRVLKDYTIESTRSSSEPAASGPLQSAFTHDTRRRPLLSTRNQVEENVLVVVPDVQTKTKEKLNAGDSNGSEDSDKSSDLERGNHSHSTSSMQAQHRVYTVTERPKTLFRRLSTSASALTAWALDYDPKAA